MNRFNKINPNKVIIQNGDDDRKEKYKVVSLFSGCGGMDLGFHGGFDFLNKYYGTNPFEIVFSNDIFKAAADVYEYNFKSLVNRTSIDELDVTILPKADIVVGGFPCQDFSHAGKRKGLDADRGRLYQHMIRVIEHVNPKIFVAENVDGLRTHKHYENSLNSLDIILNDFEKVGKGYRVEYQVLNAADYGVPQTRKRVIIIGVRSDIDAPIYYPKETCVESQGSWVSAKDAIDDLWDKIDNPDVFNHTTRDYSKAKFYPGKKMQGNNRIKADMPSPTIRAEHHGNIEAHYRTKLEDETDMSGWRRLSVRECARLQSFPDKYNFNVSASSAYKMIGNAVPPVLGWYIARAVLKILD